MLAVVSRQVVHAALWLVAALGALAGCYLVLGAEVVALVQVLVYVGAIVVLVLFVVLAIAFIRIIRASSDSFARIVTAGVMVWVIGQAFVNIAVVLGVLPVLGVPLPLISAGGTALIANLLGIGIVLSFARGSSTRPGETIGQSPAERSRTMASQRVRSRA
nr:NADH-quinone oxidoreductase subunit J [Salinibacterium sp.]